MLSRLLALILLAWALGFVAFAVSLPGPAGAVHTDGVVVLTGGEGRIGHALEVLRAHQAGRLLVSGVDQEVRAAEFKVQYGVAPDLFACCVTLGYEAVDTRSNAQEAARWAAGQHLASLRLVTSDWHMRRAAFELRHALPAAISVVEDAVPTQPSFNTLLTEYSKLLVRHAARLWPG